MKERLAALHSYHILDTAREEEYDKLTELASRICGVPVSLISLIDEERTWTKAATGMPIHETPRSRSISSLTILRNGSLEIPDTTKDSRVSALPAVTEKGAYPFLRRLPADRQETACALGALCVCDL